ncbi:MAG TPA: hypothetical protein VND24_06485 [Steroidobacteraceae bacterium]|nr:hypothetical protein [Steroidobacteraceae bacterium]
MVILFVGVVGIAAYAWFMASMVLKLEDDFQATTSAAAQSAAEVIEEAVGSVQRRSAAVTAAGRRAPARSGVPAAARAR